MASPNWTVVLMLGALAGVSSHCDGSPPLGRPSLAFAIHQQEKHGPASASSSPKMKETRVSVTMHRDIEFANIDDVRLKLDLYVPAGDVPAPLVVWIHGGGWRGGSKARPPLRTLTQHGYALASISYRFTDQAIFPAQIHDCKGAIRWLRAHAKKYGFNADWIAVAGSSAGGHLALLLGVSGDVEQLEGKVGGHLDHSSKVQAIIDYFGPTDFVLRGKTQPERAYTEKSGSFALLGGVQNGEVTRKMEEFASPTSYVSQGDPPLLIFHGTADDVVLLDQSRQIAALYEKHKLDARLITIVEAGHGGVKFFSGKAFENALAFLNRHSPQ